MTTEAESIANARACVTLGSIVDRDAVDICRIADVTIRDLIGDATS